MHRFTVSASEQCLDLPLCVSSGQVFRWQELSDGRWLGVDGDRWYGVARSSAQLSVESNGTRQDFESLFRLDWDSDAVKQQILAKGPELAPYMEALRGLRVMRPSDPEETFFSFLCTPNNNVARITGMVRTLASFGPRMGEFEGVAIHRFPDAQIIAGIGEEALRQRRFGYRARTITTAARELLSRGDGWLSGLKSAPYQTAFEELLAIPGVGPKLSDCICLFGLDHTEAVPVDTHIWQQVVRLYRPNWAGKSLTLSRYREAGDLFRERFGKRAGWAHQYLFYDNLLNWRARR